MANATWLANVLRAAGVPVIEQSGWQSRAQSGSFTPVGLIRHWDASSPGTHGAIEYMQANIACNISTCRGNSNHGPTVHVIAAGRAYHAGEGQFGAFPRDQGNTYAIGHEVAHTVDEPWGSVQLDVVTRAERAILAHLGADVSQEWCTHDEYAPTRKIDTQGGAYGQDTAAERAKLSGASPPLPTNLEEVEAMLLQRQSDKVGVLITGGHAIWVSSGSDYSAMKASGVPGAVVSDNLFGDVITAMGGATG
jgi:hypothetical protein